MELVKLIKLLEEKETALYCNKVVLNDGLIRYYDNALKDMYDHNYYECEYVNEDILNKCKEYSFTRKEHHIKFFLEKPDYKFLEDNGFECGTLLTMLKTNNDFGNKFNSNLTFKNIKNEDIYDDLLALELKHYGSVYGKDFCVRKSNRIFNIAKEKDSCINYYAAYIDNKIVASCSVVVGDNVIGLDDLLTDNDYRKQYIATTLMKHVYDRYNVPMYLHADGDDTPKDMYFKLGFEVVDKIYECLYMENIQLVEMTREMYHEYFKDYENDHDIYFDESSYVEYVYSYENVEKYINRQIEKNRKCFAIMLNKKMIGEIKLCDIEDNKKATLSIALRHKELKDRGYGTIAEKLAVEYAFDKLNIPTIYADSILPNTRSQHVLEKIGFKFVGISNNRKNYKLERKEYYKN